MSTTTNAPTPASPAAAAAAAAVTVDRKPLSSRLEPLVWLLAIAALLFVFGKSTLDDPTQTAATRDPAWYTWRSGLIVHSDDPGSVADEWGPFSMFSGGYRVSVPVSGALLQDISGANQITFPGFMMVGVPILAGLALAAGAWRSTKDSFLSVLTMFVVGVFFLTTPYVGYLDNLFVLFILGSLIAFLEPARHSWGARSAVFMLALLAMFTHPTTCVVFLGTVFAVSGFHLLSMGFKIRRVLDRDLPGLLAVFSGMMLGAVLWVGGGLFLWGHPGNLIDAALPPPYPKDFFVGRFGEWIASQWWYLTGPLIIVAVCWIALTAFRKGTSADAFRTMSAWWLLPYVASALTFYMGKVIPYYRFMNSTAAIMPLVAIGIWVIARWALGKSKAGSGVRAVSWVVILGFLSFVFVTAVGIGYETSKWNDPVNQWVDQDTRAAMASVAAVAASDPTRPIVFVDNYFVKYSAYGWAKTYSNASRSSLPSGVGPRAFQYFGTLEDFLAGQRTATDPSCDSILEGKSLDDIDLSLVTGGKKKDANGVVIKKADGFAEKIAPRPECTYDLVSAGFFLEMQKGVEEHGGEPFVFMVKGFNGELHNDSTNLDYWKADAPSKPGFDSLTPLGPNVFLVSGEGLTTPEPTTIDAAKVAGVAEAAALKQHQQDGPFTNLPHLLRVLFGLFFLIALPGLIAARWFGLRAWQEKLGLVPVISIGMNILMAIAVISVTRSAFGPTSAWISVGLTTASAGGLNVLARNREKKGPGKAAEALHSVATKLGDQVEDMAIPFQRSSFKSLMMTQFVSQLGDGVIQGTIFLSLLSTSGKGPAAVLSVIFLTYLPFSFLAPITGVLSDRYDRRQLLLFANIVRVVLGLAMAALLFTGVTSNGVLVALLLMVLGGARLVLLVKGAGLADAAGGKDLLMANSLSQMGGAIFQVVGVALGLVIVTILPLNYGAAVFAAAAIYFVAYIYARGVSRIEKQAVEGSLGKALRRVAGDVAGGIREIAAKPAAAIGILSFWLTRTLVFGFVGLTVIFHVAVLLQANPGQSVPASTADTAIQAFFGVLGAVISLFLVKRLEDKVAPAHVLRRSMYVAGIFALLVPVGTAIGIGLLAKAASALFAGIAFFLVKVSADTLTQRALPDDFRGRAYALFDISYALSYAVPAGVLFFLASAGLSLDLGLAGWGFLVLVGAFILGRWAQRAGMFDEVSDDLTEEELAAGSTE